MCPPWLKPPRLCNTGERERMKTLKEKDAVFTVKKYIAYCMLLQPIYLFMVGCFCCKNRLTVFQGIRGIQNWDLGLVLDCLQDWPDTGWPWPRSEPPHRLYKEAVPGERDTGHVSARKWKQITRVDGRELDGCNSPLIIWAIVQCSALPRVGILARKGRRKSCLSSISLDR